MSKAADKNARGNKRGNKRIILAGLVLLALAGVFAYGFSLFSRINQTDLVLYGEDEEVRRPKPSDIGISDGALLKKRETGVENILLLGIDRRSPQERGRSDTMIIASIDRKNKEVKLTSLMRDMYVPISGRQDNRINAAWAFGGAGLAVKTVNQVFDLNIEHYVALDFLGFEEIVDLMGGAEVPLTSAESRIVGVGGAGNHKLNGSQVLAYARIRSIGSDFQRTERQRTVIAGIYQQAMKKGFFELVELLAAGLPHVETNLTKLQMVKLGREVLGFNHREIEEFRVPVTGTFSHQNIRGMAVLLPDLEKNRELLHQFIYD